MNKEEFLCELKKGLTGLPEDDINERISFYSEMIDDRIEEGLSESEAVEDMGDVNEIVSQIIKEVPLTKIVKEKIKPKRQLNTLELVLLIVGFPIWLPLLITLFALVLSVFVVLWSLLISLWAIEVAILLSGLGLTLASILFFVGGKALPGLLLIGAGFTILGISSLLFVLCLLASKGTVILTKKIALGIKSLIVKGGKTK